MKKKWQCFYRDTKEEMLQVVGNSNLPYLLFATKTHLTITGLDTKKSYKSLSSKFSELFFAEVCYDGNAFISVKF